MNVRGQPKALQVRISGDESQVSVSFPEELNRQPGMKTTDLLTYVTEKFCVMWTLGVVNQGFDFDYLFSICLFLSSDGFLQGHKTTASSNYSCVLLQSPPGERKSALL